MQSSSVEIRNDGFRGSSAYTGVEIDFSASFHVFACEWTPDFITYYVDGVQAVKMPNYNNGPLFLRFQTEIDNLFNPDPATFEADRNDPTPHYLEIDYVRAWQRKSVALATTAAGAASELVLYPNPAHESLSLRTTQATPYTIRTTLGQAVLRGTTAAGSATPVTLAGLTPGVYLVEMRTGAGPVVRRFTKE
ncbi:T9SS type A sorting domain-containing protein [Hymenobacter terrenus]|uniref:T9SS type A sorting domain-containing protein n=1 Tax=Hymenobacter terrenus TaxID=1629124 RepID=UPI0018CF3B19|nr:T9SS type A sorting domain-containing protein [Hymenobacter terrenus]